MVKRNLLLSILALGILLGSASFSSAQTNVSGTITTNTTWTFLPNPPNNGSPYIVTGNITVNPGVTLTIQPGVEVKFAGNYSMTVNGTLNAAGTAAQMIKFTSNQSTPARGDWDRIAINSGGNTLSYLQVEYASTGVYVGFNINQNILNSVFVNNSTGIFMQDLAAGTIQGNVVQLNEKGIYSQMAATPNIVNNTITNNVDGIYVYCQWQNGCFPTINNNSIFGNTSYNLRFSVAGGAYWVIRNVENNWWGSQNVNTVMAGINDYADNQQLPTADIFPYLDAPNGNPIGQSYLYGNTVGTLQQSLSPFIVVGAMRVMGTLNIQPGVELKFAGNYGLLVEGTLNAAGTASQRIKFTSNQTTPVKGDWQSININSTGNTLTYLQVEYADTGIAFGAFGSVTQSIFQNNNTGVAANAGSPAIQNNIMQNNGRGIYTHVGTSPNISNNTVTNNTNGIEVFCTYQGGCFPIINNNSIHSNTGYNLNVTGIGENWIINAENNWWGSQSVSTIMAGIRDYADNPALPTVDIFPYLDAPNGNPMGQSYLYGNLAGTLQQSLSPYIVVGNARVVGTLNIQPGVEVRFAGNYSLTVFGTLNAAGTASQRIKFTSNQSTPARGDWGGIAINSPGNTLNYLQVEYATTGISIGGGVNQSISNSVIENNTNGIYISDVGFGTIQNNTIQNNEKGIYSVLAAYPNIISNTITNNTDGIYVLCPWNNGCTPVISNNSIHSNTGKNLQITGNAYWVIINAENNWWGSQNLTTIMAGINDYADNPALPTADIFPYLDAPNGSPMGHSYLYGALNGTIPVSNSPYTVIGNLIVTGFGNVTIQPGVEFKFAGNYGLQMDGVLNAAGTAAQRIKFTSNQTTPARGDWGAIQIATGSATIDYWQVEYGTTGLSYNAYGVNKTIQNSLFQNNATAISLNSANEIILQNNTITNNVTGVYSNRLSKFRAINNTIINNTDGIWVFCYDTVCDTRINNNSIHTNSGYNLKTQIGVYRVPWVVYDAENNWWNSTSYSVIAAGIWDNADNPNLPPVDFDPFWSGPNGQSVVTNVSVSPQFFDPFSSQNTNINYTIAADSNVTIKIFSHTTNTLVRTLLNAVPKLAGAQMEVWDGKDDTSQFLPPGPYYFTIDVLTTQNVAGGYSPVYWAYPVPITSGVITPSNFNPYRGETATISYNIQSPAILGLKVGVPQWQGPAPDRTIFTNQPRQSLQNSDAWDGRNDAGNIVPPDNVYLYTVWGWADPIRLNGVNISNSGFRIDSLTISPYVIYPLYGEITEIKYQLPQSASITVTIEDPANTIVRTLVNNQLQTAGQYVLAWDGRDSSGNVVSSSAHYKVKVRAVHSSGVINSTLIRNITVFK